MLAIAKFPLYKGQGGFSQATMSSSKGDGWSGPPTNKNEMKLYKEIK